MSSKTLIIAEGELNHNGDVNLAKKLVKSAYKVGADYIKFQCFTASSFAVPGSSFLPIFEKNELTIDEFQEILEYSRKVGITMISTATDHTGLDMILSMDLPVIKISSTNITNLPLLERISEINKPIYLSTGAATLGEIGNALETLNKRNNKDLTLFHCSVQYPAQDHILNLRAISTMLAAFPGIPVGYSDHTVGNTAAIVAVSLGATVLEKHFTLDNAMEGPDHSFSTNPVDFAEYVNTIRKMEKMLGSPEKSPSIEELDIRISGRRYVTSKVAIKKGEIIEPFMIESRRIDVNNVDAKLLLEPQFEKRIIGWKATQNIMEGRPITFENFFSESN